MEEHDKLMTTYQKGQLGNSNEANFIEDDCNDGDLLVILTTTPNLTRIE